MGKTPRNYTKGDSRGFINYVGRQRHGTTYSNQPLHQLGKNFVVGQKNDPRNKSSRLLKITTK